MTRDRLRHRIDDGLARPLDRDLFEACVLDLLRDTYKTLVPIVGGNDAGLDGAIGTPDGPFPLICTTAQDVLRNVKKNLGEYLARHNGPKLAVVATSQALTPARKRNVEAGAHSLGITVVNIHDRPDIVNRLYRNRAWLKDLLGITGDIPALSSLPPTGRLHGTPSLIVRRSELDALTRATGDFLIIGQPGSGKTFLHQVLAETGQCYFVTTDNRQAIAEDVREYRPHTIVVDDAHTKPHLLRALLHLRAELNADFSIHGNCWPGTEGEVLSILELAAGSILTLEALPRDETLEVIRACGIQGPDQLLHHLLNQAEGKPGLAVVLAEACKRGSLAQVWTGEFLTNYLLQGRSVAAHDRERSMLAGFAIGGDAGMRFADVAATLGIPPIELRGTCAGLGQGGVLEVDGQDLVVRPTVLQAWLVKEVFYGQGPRLDPSPLVALTPSPSETCRVLAMARRLGGAVPPAAIEAMAGRSTDLDAWEYFGWADAECARLILGAHPDRLRDAASGLLHYVPRDTIPRLLTMSHEDATTPEGASGHPMRLISTWLLGDVPFDPGHLGRRRLLLEEAVKWARVADTRDSKTLAQAIGMAIDPEFESHTTKPGSGRVIGMLHAVYPAEQLHAIGALWNAAFSTLSDMSPSCWGPLIKPIEKWCFPGRMARTQSIPTATVDILQSIGTRMLSDLVSHPRSTRAVRTWAAHTAARASLALEVQVDPGFDLLFGDRDRDLEYGEALAQRRVELERYSDDLSGLGEDQALGIVRGLEREATEFGRVPGGWDRHVVYQGLAANSADPLRWVDALVQDGCDRSLVFDFLEAGKHKDPSRYRDTLAKLHELPPHRLMASRCILALDPPDLGLLSKVLGSVRFTSETDAHWLASFDIPIETIASLLRSEHPPTRTAAAVSEWARDPEGSIRRGLVEHWREAILASSLERGDYEIKRILAVFRSTVSWTAATV